MKTSIKLAWSIKDALYIALIIVVVGFAYGMYVDIGGFWWTDESRHAMDGVFILDFVQDRPIDRPYDYTVEYFVHYPALGLTWYLPFFAVVESIFFAVGEISEATARLTVVIFLAIGVLSWYAWVRSLWGATVALLSVLFFLINPMVLLWGRSVMLDVPAVALVMLGVYVYDQYLQSPTHKKSLAVGIIIGSAILTKQNTIFILPVLLFYPALTGSARKLWIKESVWAYLFIAIALIILVAHALTFGMTAVGGIEKRSGILLSGEAVGWWLQNARVIASAYPLPLLLLAAISIPSFFTKHRKSQDLLIILWVICWYIVTSFLSGSFGNVQRYTIYLSPAIGFLAARVLVMLSPQRTAYLVMSFLLFSLVVYYGYIGLSKEQPYVSGYDKAAEFVKTIPEKSTILFCCKHDGNFVFHSRKNAPNSNAIILRADKVLVSFAVHKSYGIKSYVDDAADIYETLDRYGVGLVVTEDRDLVGMPEFKKLLELLSDDKFKLLKEIPVDTNMPKYSQLKIKIYRYLDRKPLQKGIITIPMPHIGRDLKIKLND